MYLILTSSKDTYVTNKIINSSFRAVDSNVGRAGTLDLFKLYNESIISGESDPVEVSRVLIKFEYNVLSALTSSEIDIADPSFKCYLHMKDVLGTQSVPRNFNLIAFPLSMSFDEGDGRDVGSFSDIDICNFITSSYANGIAYTWNEPGANKQGLLGSSDIDIISSGNIGSGVENFGVSQNFYDGTENLVLDVTKIVSASLSGLIPNNGFRISFTPAEETDFKSRFVKRFASRHAKNVFNRPTLHVLYDDSIQDNHSNFEFDSTGSLFLSSYRRGAPANLLSGTSLIPVVGENCLSLTIRTGSYSITVPASMFTGSTTGQGTEGLYYASFAIPLAEPTIIFPSSSIKDFAIKSGSLTFDEIWHSNDGSIGFYTGSLIVKSPLRTAFINAQNSAPVLKVTNLSGEYKNSDKVKVRLFGLDTKNYQNKPAKFIQKVKSEIFDEVYYRVVDTDTGNVVIPFTKSGNATRCSVDSEGMYFNFRMDALFPGRVYHFEFSVTSSGVETVIAQKSSRFKVSQ